MFPEMHSTRLTKFYFLLFTVLAGVNTLILTPNAYASFIRLIPLYEVTVDQSKGVADISFKLTNEGDEQAIDTGIDIVSLNELHIGAKLLKPEESASFNVTVPLSSLNIKSSGTYTLACRTVYKDSNFYQFSAPFFVDIDIPPVPGRSLVMNFKGATGLKAVSLQQSLDIPVTISNISERDLVIEELRPLSSAELLVSLSSTSKMPQKLSASGSLYTGLNIKNSGQALLGSTYSVGLIASGLNGEKHFSEHYYFQVRIDAGHSVSNLLMKLALGIIAFLGLLLWVIRRKRSAE